MCDQSNKSSSDLDQADMRLIDHLADAVADNWENGVIGEDPFDLYVKDSYAKISIDRHVFRGRMRRGYHILCQSKFVKPDEVE